MSTYLKPCPFCGNGDVSMWYRGTRYGRIAMVTCDTCGAGTKAFRYYDDGKDVNENDYGMQNAIAAWNRRTNEDDLK